MVLVIEKGIREMRKREYGDREGGKLNNEIYRVSQEIVLLTGQKE